jgi:hypothetical protein
MKLPIHLHNRKDQTTMGNPNQRVDEAPVPDPDETTAPTDDAIQAAVDAALAKFAAENGLEPPAAAEPAPSALHALEQLQHTTFGEKILTLAKEGIGEAELIEETPAVRALAKVVGELTEKVA